MKLIKAIPQQQRNDLEKCYFVGRLISENEAHMYTTQESNVHETSNELIYFHIKCLTEIPSFLQEVMPNEQQIFTGNTYEQTNKDRLATFYFSYDSKEEKIRKVKKGLENKLIVFSFYFQDAEMIYVRLHQIENTKPANFYKMIPSPESVSMKEQTEDFEQRLIDGERPIKLTHYPTILSRPQFIYKNEVIYHALSLRHSPTESTIYYQNRPSQVTYARIPIEDFATVVSARVGQDLYFIEEEQYKSLVNLVMEKENRLVPEHIEKTMRKQFAQSFQANDIKEVDFINYLERLTINQQLFFKRNDLVYFHTSVKTNPLTIIGGRSGIGKTRLAQIYGEALGLKLNETMRIIPISPSYHEPSDLLGFYHPSMNRYFESETGLVEILLRAEKNPDELHLVIFDEMNLSQVEHWFSPFLSLLELQPKDRFLSLYGGVAETEQNVPHQIHIGDNLIFVGTVNFDETTQSFSNRFLDRVNIITPETYSFKEIATFMKQISSSKEIETMHISKTMFRDEWTYETEWYYHFDHRQLDFFDDLHQLLSTYDPKQGISYRVVQSIGRYMSNIPFDPKGRLLIEKTEVFDRQIAQRILTKIRGHEALIAPLIGTFSNQQYQGGSLEKLFSKQDYQVLSNFEYCKKIVFMKAKEMMHYGFAY